MLLCGCSLSTGEARRIACRQDAAATIGGATGANSSSIGGDKLTASRHLGRSWLGVQVSVLQGCVYRQTVASRRLMWAEQGDRRRQPWQLQEGAPLEQLPVARSLKSVPTRSRHHGGCKCARGGGQSKQAVAERLHEQLCSSSLFHSRRGPRTAGRRAAAPGCEQMHCGGQAGGPGDQAAAGYGFARAACFMTARHADQRVRVRTLGRRAAAPGDEQASGEGQSEVHETKQLQDAALPEQPVQ